MITDKKVLEAEYTGNDVSTLLDRPSEAGMSASDLKARFDALLKIVLLPKYNSLIDTLASVYGASNIGFERTALMPFDDAYLAIKGAYTYAGQLVAEAQIPSTLPKAENISVADAGGKFTAENVETALLELFNTKEPTLTLSALTAKTTWADTDLLLIHDGAKKKLTVAYLKSLLKVDGLTSEAQAQINGKEPTLTLSGLTAKTTWADTDLILLDDGAKKKMTVAYLKSLMNTALNINPAWTAITLSSSWTNNTGTSFAGRIMPDGSLQLKGSIVNGTKTDATVIGTLPVALRLPYLVAVPCSNSGAINGLLWVQPDGAVKIYGFASGGSGIYISAVVIPPTA